MKTMKIQYRVCNSDDGSVVALTPTRALIEASLAAGTEGHVRAVVVTDDDGQAELDLAPPHTPRQDTVRVYVEER